MLFKILFLFLPWTLRRRALERLFGYKISSSAYIGFAWIYPRKLIMEGRSRIDHFTVAIHLDLIKMGKKSLIGRSNWITGYPTLNSSKHFKHQPERAAELIVGESSSITKKHHFDCTNQIKIGQFSTIAGYDSQFLTHSINLNDNRQDSKPILIGDYTFVGTNVTVLGGSVLPSYSVLGAKSLLNKSFSSSWKIYAGVPAKEITNISKDAKYFNRKIGFVY
jgi:acetyltransferase-like isoleucine patch superfamily enzyme